ncbi:MAG: tyrosinase family protein [Acidobacteriota bacterium]|nr:tyrosinase family protein [Acidobacteriota bacterium]
MKIIRRIALLFVSVLFVTVAAFAQKPTRLSWQEFAKDPNRVQSFRNAVAEMRVRSTAPQSSATFRKSWQYWASIHGYFGTTAKNKTVEEFRVKYGLTSPSLDQYFVGVDNTTPPDSIARTVWDQCEHGTIYFFGWHRLFLFYFEQALQDAAGDPNLRLPYWDYTDTANLAMPAEFTTPTYVNTSGVTVDNPLYDARRNTGWNNGGTNKLNANNTDIDRALKNPSFLDTSTAQGFQNVIDASPHGYTHCAVNPCKRTVMGAVAYSSNDPIFWIHHANIDRMWDCWMSISGHTNPSSIMGKSYTLVDGTGTPVTKTIGNLFDGSLINYVYQQASNCQRATTPRVSAAPQTKRVQSARRMLARPVTIGTLRNTLLDAAVTKKRVTLDATASLDHPRQFALDEQSELPVATELILRGIRFEEHPTTSINVFLERVDNPAERAFVGTISFFWEEATGEETHHPQGEITRTFDATEELRELDLEGTGGLNLNVVFEAIDEPIGPDFNPAEVKLTVDEIRFLVKRD